jgi:hypothetical protein
VINRKTTEGFSLIELLIYATATPVTTSGVGATGTRRFGISEDGVLHGDMLNSLAVYTDENAVRAASATGN